MITILPRTISISDFQRRTKEAFNMILKNNEPLIVLNRNQQVGVFLNPKMYEELMEIYEDFLDGLRLAEAIKDAKKTDFTEWKTFKKYLKNKK